MRSADLHRLSRTLREIALGASGDAGERPSFGEIAVVEDLARHGPSAIGAIAERIGVAQSLVSSVTKVLTSAGITTVGDDARDGRRRLVALAPGIREGLLQPRGDRPIRGAIRAAAPHLDDADADRVGALLAELVELLGPGRSGRDAS